MKIIKASQVETEAAGNKINFFVGIVKKVFPAKTGSGQYGPWSVRNIILKDETGEVRAGVWNVDMADLEGQRVGFLVKSDKASGIVVVDNKGKKELKITEKAECLYGEDLERAESKLASGGIAVANSAPVALAVSSVVNTQEVISKKGLLMQDCIKAALEIQEAFNGSGVKIDKDHLQAIASSIFISCDREGLSRHYKLVDQSEKEEQSESDELGW